MGVPEIRNVKQSILDVAKLLVSHKGFSAVGLNEVLQAAQVPKGSFYHYFGSKDAFGVALLDGYFETYLQDMAYIFTTTGLSERQKLDRYWQQWIENQTGETDARKCLAVKLGAEVADLSEPMRLALHRGTAGVIDCLSRSLSRGVQDKSVVLKGDAYHAGHQLYYLWLGASVMAKITGTITPFDHALSMTHTVLMSLP
ncbi:TetR/AcrR family transcriptional regulator [Pseudomonas sp. NPDC088368]|jgi:TetR/AcrR family transcriptional repressor of nem operon|uniref:TetR/AcrR family transcriptional regulator n=1 Tax=Pseudomonas sp. NPDC088368 TaxID=3364453 RepID=UPI00381A7EF8